MVPSPPAARSMSRTTSNGSMSNRKQPPEAFSLILFAKSFVFRDFDLRSVTYYAKLADLLNMPISLAI